MANSTTKYEWLKAELEKLKELADNQSHHYHSSRNLLYEGLSRVYLWWLEASAEAGLLEQLYEEYNLQYKKQTIHEIAFSPLLRYLWNMNGSINSNTIDQWNRALNNINVTVQNDKSFYKTNTQNKLISFISNSGGINALAGYVGKSDEDNTATKNKISKTSEQKLKDAHLHNGKLFFASAATPIAQFKTPQTLASADSGFTLALLRKANNGYEIIGTVNDNALVEQAVIAAYKRTSEQMPNTARLITEIIRTQVLPSKIAKLAAALTDDSKFKVKEGSKEVMKQLKRLLYIAKDGKFVLSANRSDCSVVTVATPFATIFDVDTDVALAVNDRTFIENNLIHSGDFNFYTADAAQYVPATEDEPASHKLKLENTVTKQFRYIRFYRLTTFKFLPSKTQAVVNANLPFNAKYTAQLDSSWLSEMNALFLTRWIDGFGAKMKRNEHKMLMLALGKTSIAFKYNYKAQDYKEAEIVDLSRSAKAKGFIEVNVLSKDIIPVLNALVQVELDGDVTVQANEKMLRFMFKTNCADYVIAVPCCTTKAKRMGDYFETYGAE
jgi:hypothetical protein